MIRRILKVERGQSMTALVIWDDDSRSTVDFGPVAARGGVLAALADDGVSSSLAVG